MTHDEILKEAFKLFPRLITDPYNPLEDANKEDRNIWISGAKWMQERTYSEEEIIKSFENLGFKKITSEELNSQEYKPFITDEDGNIWVIDKEQWFSQFKKQIK